MEFTPITTQEGLDKIISARLTREREATAKKYGDYEDLKSRAESAETKVGELTRQLEEADARQAQHEKAVGDLTQKLIASRLEFARFEVAQEYGLPPALAARLNGSTRDELAADAESLIKLLGKRTGHSPAPRRSTEPIPESGEHAAFREMLDSMKGDS